MRIGYRRVAGKIGLTNQEEGIRGAWVEKRLALFKSFQKHGHKVVCFSPCTPQTEEKGMKGSEEYQPVDVLVLEFGGTNQQFYGDYWLKTIEIVKKHKGRIIFINDDPDLPFLWKLLPDEDWSRWTLAVNAANSLKAKEILKTPKAVKAVDYPMNSGMPFAEFYEGKIPKAVYIGRASGRKDYFKEFLKSDKLDIAGKEAEWIGFDCNVIPNPQQRLRRAFYAQYRACLAVFDDKHKDSGWRTGRAYHALYAGIPVIAPEGNAGLFWCAKVKQAQDIDVFVNQPKEVRKRIWEQQKDFVQKQSEIDLLAL